MQKLIWVWLTAGVICTSCGMRENDPHEVVGQSYIHRYGVPVEAEDWTAKGETGKVVTTLKSGVVVTKAYLGGVLEGETTYTYPHSDLIDKVETYSQGQLVKEAHYYRNGTLAEQATYQSPSQKLLLSWYDSGSPRCSETYENDLLTKGEYFDLSNHVESQVSEREGQRMRRDAFGNSLGVDTVKNGVVVLTTVYHPNGAVKQSIPYVNGHIEGQLKTFLPAGEPASIEIWTHGERTGETTLFENGEKIAAVPYVQGVKNGIEQRYRNGNQVVEEISWVNDMRHGPCSTFIGDIRKTDYFFEGRLVSKSLFEKLTATRGTPSAA